MKRKHKPTSYSLMDVMLASPTEPMPDEKRNFQIVNMRQALENIAQAPNPTVNDWRIVSDAVNMMETLVRELHLCEDAHGLLDDAVEGLAHAGRRYKAHNVIRLDARGLLACRFVLRDYEETLQALPHRAMLQCHRLTEKRIRAIASGKRQAHDIEVMDL